MTFYTHICNRLKMEDLNITTTEMHTGGAPLRIVEAGFPEIKGKTILDKIRYIRESLDDIRKFVIFEPRGHFDMFGVVFVEPDNSEADMGTIFLHNEGISTMCGHAIIAVGRYVIDRGIVKTPVSPETKIVFQCPCGPVKAFVEYGKGKTGNVRFQSVPSYVFAMDVKIEVPNYGPITIDISYGGAFYAILSAESLGLDMKTSNTNELQTAATAVKDMLMKSLKLSHPESEDLAFLYGMVLTDGQDDADECDHCIVFADRMVDRSPCGSGSTARVALQYRRGQIKIGQSKTFSGPAGSKFKAKPVREVKFGPYDAVVVEVCGKAHYTGSCTFTREADDDIGKGFLLK